MPSLRRSAALILVAVLAVGCGADDAPSASAPSPTTAAQTTGPTAQQSPAVPASSAPPAGAPTADDCPEDAVEDAVCRFVVAVQAGDVAQLSEGEQEVAGAVGELPLGDWAIEVCQLVGDVTVACEVSFAGAENPLGFHVVPVNAEYDDGELSTPEGEDVRYEVDSYLGVGESGSFTS